MIHLSDIIKAIGGSDKDYPDAQVRLFDGKDREVTSPSVTYAKPLFDANPRVKGEFETALRTALENLPEGEHICMQISSDEVILNYDETHHANEQSFMRRRPLDPLDYMD